LRQFSNLHAQLEPCARKKCVAQVCAVTATLSRRVLNYKAMVAPSKMEDGCRPMKSTLSKRKSSKAFAKLVVNSVSGKVLGVHFVGPEAAEIVQVLLKASINQICHCVVKKQERE